jgi:hypothetical protein
MKKPVIISIIVLLFLGMSAAGFAETDPDASLFERVCSQCHKLDRSLSKNKTERGWQKTVKRMLKKMNTATVDNEAVSKEDAEKIVNYLYASHGYVNPDKSEAEAKRDKLLEQFAPAKARTVMSDEQREKINAEFTPTKARTVSPTAKTVKEESE